MTDYIGSHRAKAKQHNFHCPIKSVYFILITQYIWRLWLGCRRFSWNGSGKTWDVVILLLSLHYMKKTYFICTMYRVHISLLMYVWGYKDSHEVSWDIWDVVILSHLEHKTLFSLHRKETKCRRHHYIKFWIQSSLFIVTIQEMSKCGLETQVNCGMHFLRVWNGSLIAQVFQL